MLSYIATAQRLIPTTQRFNEHGATTSPDLTMSILGNILGKIFPSFKSADAPAPAAPDAGLASAPASTSSTASAPSMATVDVEAMLNDMAASNKQSLNWRVSIVDLMKLLGLDSSLSERKALARELGYTKDMNDSTAMNIWLHRQVMNKLAANGGKVPAELKD